MKKLYTCNDGKWLKEAHNENFGAWTEENRHKHEDGICKVYSFEVFDKDITLVTWEDTDDEFFDYDYVVNADAKIEFELIK